VDPEPIKPHVTAGIDSRAILARNAVPKSLIDRQIRFPRPVGYAALV
jgi:hypothetical protein